MATEVHSESNSSFGERRADVRFHLESGPDLTDPAGLKCAVPRFDFRVQKSKHLQQERLADPPEFFRCRSLMRNSTAGLSRKRSLVGQIF
jgi:hypothetical protein